MDGAQCISENGGEGSSVGIFLSFAFSVEFNFMNCFEFSLFFLADANEILAK